jgi:GGDEF domain-containing protein
MLLEHLRAMEETLVASADLQIAFLDDLASHITASAEVDDETQLRSWAKRYAAGLSSYSRRAMAERMATVDGLRQHREQLDRWLQVAKTSSFSDPETGLLNRVAAERRIATQVAKGKLFCLILVGSSGGPVLKELAERLAGTIRPYDVIFRWSDNELITVFEASRKDIAARASQITGWLGEAKVTVIEHAGETAEEMIAKVEAARKSLPEAVEAR